jgi:cytochrome c553
MNEEIRQPIASRESRKTGFSNTWGLAVVCVLSAFVVIAFGVGFLILPATHQQRDQMSMHDNIQHALGHHVHDSMSTKNAAATSIPTYVVWDEATIHEALSGDPQRGEFIAMNCTACHGETGVAKQKWIPTLAGVNRIVLYKQLADFRSETRLSAPMSAIAQALTPQQTADVASYFASLTGGVETQAIHAPASGRTLRGTDPTLRLIYAGDPKRGLAGCATCHGPGAYRMGVPSLSGQNADYIEQQLHNFAQGSRKNDMNMPMRTVAGMLTAAEMYGLAQEFSAGQSLVK